jgi:hypothetical protein
MRGMKFDFDSGACRRNNAADPQVDDHLAIVFPTVARVAHDQSEAFRPRVLPVKWMGYRFHRIAFVAGLDRAPQVNKRVQNVLYDF